MAQRHRRMENALDAYSKEGQEGVRRGAKGRRAIAALARIVHVCVCVGSDGRNPGRGAAVSFQCEPPASGGFPGSKPGPELRRPRKLKVSIIARGGSKEVGTDGGKAQNGVVNKDSHIREKQLDLVLAEVREAGPHVVRVPVENKGGKGCVGRSREGGGGWRCSGRGTREAWVEEGGGDVARVRLKRAHGKSPLDSYFASRKTVCSCLDFAGRPHWIVPL
jgi:hypothetical protein